MHTAMREVETPLMDKKKANNINDIGSGNEYINEAQNTDAEIIDDESKDDESKDDAVKDEIVSRRHVSLHGSKRPSAKKNDILPQDKDIYAKHKKGQSVEIFLFSMIMVVLFSMVFVYLVSFMVPARYQSSESEIRQLNTIRPPTRRK